MNTEHDQFDDFMRDLLHEGGLEQAPDNFTQAVMGQIAAEAAPARRAPKPLISRWGWIGIAASMVITCIVSLVLSKPSGKPLPGQAQAEAAIDGFMGFFGTLQFPTILVMSTLAIVLLFGLDRVLKRRSEHVG
jgi:hypothetical protein